MPVQSGRRGGSKGRSGGHSGRRSHSGGQKKHLAGAGPKEQRMYEHIKESARKSGRYGARAKEVAARTVMKEHKRKGHQKGR